MKRTKKKSLPIIPDAINNSFPGNFTIIPNDMLRNPYISCKAKTVLCLLLSNSQGWKSFVTTLAGFLKEGEDTIRTALKELEHHGYMMRFEYRSKETKQWRGWLWCYTNVPHQLDFEASLKLLKQHSLESPKLEKWLMHRNAPDRLDPDPGSPTMGKVGAKNINNKKTNESTSLEEEPALKKSASNGYITPKDFFKFWEIYPVSRRGSKGDAMTKWETLCNNKNLRPTWNRIERAIKKQKETPRWKDPKFIPLAPTWIYQKRWLDDPAQMVSFASEEEQLAERHVPTTVDQMRQKMLEEMSPEEKAENIEKYGTATPWFDKKRK